ncbi:enhanced serine sensitivity protein SseB C-terminal domain-containing protein [Compostimonas suwonensis]|nr:enhanced serine sensitivity protein SseB C-terminal domain-containing protein [Compostimonas suwonensis]
MSDEPVSGEQSGGFPHNDLEGTLAAAYRGEVPVDDVIAALLDAPVWVPFGGDEGLLTGDFDENDPPGLLILDHDGHEVVPVYTSVELFAASFPDRRAINPPAARDFLEQLPPPIGASVNAGQEISLVMPHHAVREALGLSPDLEVGQPGESIPGVNPIEPGTRIRVGEPPTEPAELVSTVAAALRAVPPAVSARRAWVQIGELPPVLLIEVELVENGEDDRRAVVEAINSALRGTDPGFGVEITFARTGPAGLTWLVNHVGPFYGAGSPGDGTSPTTAAPAGGAGADDGAAGTAGTAGASGADGSHG